MLLAYDKGIPIYKGSLRKKDGRVIVFCRKFPGSHKSGYALRTRIVWWLHTGEILQGDSKNIHHVNGIRNDDRISNLEKLTRYRHSKLHNVRVYSWPMCETCHDHFQIFSWRLNDPKRGKFCSQKCYQKRKRVLNRVTMKCGTCKENFSVTPFRSKFTKHCSHKCAVIASWKTRRKM